MDTSNDHTHTNTHTKKILFVTNAESGQANTILAMALEASTRPQLEAHIASFPILERRVTRLSPNVVFHPLDGVDLKEAITAQGMVGGTVPHRPRSGAFKAYGRNMAFFLTGWEGDGTSNYGSSFLGMCVMTERAVLYSFFLSIYADMR